MPYKSEKQRKYFNANREKLEAEGVDVDHWNEESKGKPGARTRSKDGSDMCLNPDFSDISFLAKQAAQGTVKSAMSDTLRRSLIGAAIGGGFGALGDYAQASEDEEADSMLDGTISGAMLGGLGGLMYDRVAQARLAAGLEQSILDKAKPRQEPTDIPTLEEAESSPYRPYYEEIALQAGGDLPDPSSPTMSLYDVLGKEYPGYALKAQQGAKKYRDSLRRTSPGKPVYTKMPGGPGNKGVMMEMDYPGRDLERDTAEYYNPNSDPFMQNISDESLTRQVPYTEFKDREAAQNHPIWGHRFRDSSEGGGVQAMHLNPSVNVYDGGRAVLSPLGTDQMLLIRRDPRSLTFDTRPHELTHATQARYPSSSRLGDWTTPSKEHLERMLTSDGNLSWSDAEPIASYLSDPLEEEAYLSDIKRKYFKATGKVVNDTTEARKALDWYRTHLKGRKQSIPLLDEFLEAYPESKNKEKWYRRLMQVMPGLVQNATQGRGKVARDQSSDVAFLAKSAANAYAPPEEDEEEKKKRGIGSRFMGAAPGLGATAAGAGIYGLGAGVSDFANRGMGNDAYWANALGRLDRMTEVGAARGDKASPLRQKYPEVFGANPTSTILQEYAKNMAPAAQANIYGYPASQLVPDLREQGWFTGHNPLAASKDPNIKSLDPVKAENLPDFYQIPNPAAVGPPTEGGTMPPAFVQANTMPGPVDESKLQPGLQRNYDGTLSQHPRGTFNHFLEDLRTGGGVGRAIGGVASDVEGIPEDYRNMLTRGVAGQPSAQIFNNYARRNAEAHYEAFQKGPVPGYDHMLRGYEGYRKMPESFIEANKLKPGMTHSEYFGPKFSNFIQNKTRELGGEGSYIIPNEFNTDYMGNEDQGKLLEEFMGSLNPTEIQALQDLETEQMGTLGYGNYKPLVEKAHTIREGIKPVGDKLKQIGSYTAGAGLGGLAGHSLYRALKDDEDETLVGDLAASTAGAGVGGMATYLARNPDIVSRLLGSRKE